MLHRWLCGSVIFLNFTYSFIYGCAGALLLRAGFLLLWRVGILFVVVCGFFILVASLLPNTGSRCSCWGTQVQLPHVMWNLPRPGNEPVSPALAGRFLTTGPPERSPSVCSCSVLCARLVAVAVDWQILDVSEPVSQVLRVSLIPRNKELPCFCLPIYWCVCCQSTAILWYLNYDFPKIL